MTSLAPQSEASADTTIISVANGDLVRKSTCEGHKNHIMVRLSKTVATFETEEERVKKGG